METASSSSLTYRMSIMGVVCGCGQLLYWMGGARRMDCVVELPENGLGCAGCSFADINPGNHNLPFFPT